MAWDKEVEFKCSLIAAEMINDYNQLPEEKRKQIMAAPKPVVALGKELIEKYGVNEYKKKYLSVSPIIVTEFVKKGLSLL